MSPSQRLTQANREIERIEIEMLSTYSAAGREELNRKLRHWQTEKNRAEDEMQGDLFGCSS